MRWVMLAETIFVFLSVTLLHRSDIMLHCCTAAASLSHFARCSTALCDWCSLHLGLELWNWPWFWFFFHHDEWRVELINSYCHRQIRRCRRDSFDVFGFFTCRVLMTSSESHKWGNYAKFKFFDQTYSILSWIKLYTAAKRSSLLSNSSFRSDTQITRSVHAQHYAHTPKTEITLSLSEHCTKSIMAQHMYRMLRPNKNISFDCGSSCIDILYIPSLSILSSELSHWLSLCFIIYHFFFNHLLHSMNFTLQLLHLITM